MNEPIRAALERLVELEHGDWGTAGWGADLALALAAARAALEAAQPDELPAWRGLISRMADELDHCRQLVADDRREVHPLAEEARAALDAAPAPPAPAAGEVGELVSWLDVVSEQFRLAELYDEATQTDRAAALLKQLSAAQAPQPPAGWQPIDTAPRDGTEILASDYDAIDIVSWENPWGDAPGWHNRGGSAMYPAWWQPLADHPPLPATTPAGREGADA